MLKSKIIALALIITFFISLPTFSQTPPVSQTGGGISQQQKQLKGSKELQERIEYDRKKAEELTSEDVAAEDEGEKVLIKAIKVEGATLVPEEVIRDITIIHEGKKISLKTMQRITDLITDEYRKRGYATSRAYIPPQTMREGVLIIRVVEGLLGSLEMRGNKYFKTSLLEKRIKVTPGEVFDYSELQDALAYINEHPDRTVKVVLVPGAEPGTTDVVLEVEDNFPFHLGYEYDNYSSRYLGEYRHSLTVEHNNLFGFDDKLFFKLQMSETDLYKLKQARYSIPISNTIETGFYLARSKTKLGEEFEVVDSRGEVEIYGVFLNKKVISNPNLDLRLNFGFDYKNIENYLLGSLDSRDELRVFKAGFDLDMSDKWGRNIFTAELDAGVPDILGGMPAKVSSTDTPSASRTGGGGKFYKGVFNLFRLQAGPFGSSFLVKNQAQFSNYNLVASEQFQIGGPATVRGYPVAEYAGDRGLYSSFEWSFPCYLMPKGWKVPFTKKDTFHDALRTVLFYDWGTVHLNKVLTGDKKHRTLKSAGFGFRFNLSNDISARVEVGYPLGVESSDNEDHQEWFELSVLF
ncbi:MAG: hypothetical protein K9L86_07185 [Candidatus Omnitrophica bacterium]|nr:hypothetical protein [Candidatus Omnitrophota bacterium]